MQCNILKNLYVKSNGDIRCDDDYGERILLGKITATSVFSPTALFNNEQYTQIRNSFAKGLPPWVEICENCAFYRDGLIDNTVIDKRISKVQLEPSLLCTLKCPDCSRINQIKAGRKPLLMTTTLLENFLKGLIQEDYSVQRFELCGQGEPLNHPSLNVLISLINHYFPSADVCLITNGNFDAFKRLSNCKLTEVIVSADGVNQRAYEQYRINGIVSQCLNFLGQVRDMFPDARIIWKYILFRHNDSDEEILLAQKVAEEKRVDELRFVNTTYGPYSTRFQEYPQRPIPIVTKLVSVDSHPFIPNTLSVLQVVSNNRVLRRWLVQSLNAAFSTHFGSGAKKVMRKIFPSYNHKIEKVSLVKEGDKYSIYIDGWAKEKRSIILSVENKQKPIKRAFSKRYISWYQRIRGKLGYRTEPGFRTTGFRERFPVGNDIPEQGINLDVIHKRTFFSSNVSYQLKRTDVIAIKQIN
uniref:hypothetical protein n=1 Tax=Ningiella ruwaisensis TaxID=2364274 RepID=UPI0010A0B01B|nr:hypothetical protein [Ningiella ruwaisensis]